MRHGLKKIEGERSSFIAIFERFGRKAEYNGQGFTVLLKDVRRSSGERITDHLWFSYTKGFQALYLVKGDFIRFNARVKTYSKGHEESHRSHDYKLFNPTKIEKLPFNNWGDLVTDPALASVLKIEDEAHVLLDTVELSLLGGANADANEFLALFREQHTRKLSGVTQAWLNPFDYMVRNATKLAAVIKAYRSKEYVQYVLLHDPTCRADALSALGPIP